MKRLTLICAMALALAACGGDGADDTTTSAGDVTTTEAPGEPTTTAAASPSTTAEDMTSSTAGGGGLSVADTSLGEVLADADGFTVYIFTSDTAGTSTCYGDCEANWPPVEAGVEAGEGVTATLGETTRDDDTAQLTVNGRPAYTFGADQAPGDVNGQGVGEVWFAVGPDGEPIEG